jgi:hypothetical protein
MCFKLYMESILALVCTVVPLVNAFVHIFGFLSGFVLGFFLFVCNRKVRDPGSTVTFYKCRQYTCAFLLVVVLGLTVAGLTITLLVGSNAEDFCPWCEHLNCFDLPRNTRAHFWDCSSWKVASCEHWQHWNSSNLDECFALDPHFSEPTCFIVKCADGTLVPYNEQPNPNACYFLCGSTGNVCGTPDWV